jgi:superfamily I DNA/RNA helicase
VRAILEALRRAGTDRQVRSALTEVVAALTENGGSPALEGAARLLARAVDEHATDEVRPTVGSFLAWVAANRGATDAEAGLAEDSDIERGRHELSSFDAVTLATFHQAKGLEWPTVALVGLEEGTVPIHYATSRQALAEERRLLFVAVTRAESRLWLSWAAHSGVRPGRARRASPLLGPIRGAVASEAPLPTDAALARLGALRERLVATT